MHSKRIITLVVPAMVLITRGVSAQNSVSIAGGVALPLGGDANALNTGYNATLALTAKPPLASVGIRLEAMFNALGFKESSAGARTQRIVAATANATLSDPATPLRTFYLIAGLGAYNTRVVGGPTRKGNNDIGFNVGLGMTLTNAVGTFVEVRYHHVPSEAATMKLLPVTFGLKF